MSGEKIDFTSDLFLRTILDNSQDTIYFKDLESRFILNNQKHLEQFGVKSQDDLIGKSDFDFFSKEFAEKSHKEEQNIIHTKKPIINNVEKDVKPDGSVTWFSASKYPFFDDNGKVIGTWGMSKDITAVKEYEESLELANQKLDLLNRELEEISSKDELSTLYNRRFFYNILNKFFQDNNCETKYLKLLSIILIDIDKFKSINDTYGHLIGDKVIQYCSKMIKKVTGKMGLCFRYGGDELVIICLDSQLKDVISLAKTLRETADNNPFVENEINVHFTFSIGVSNYCELSSDKKTPTP